MLYCKDHLTPSCFFKLKEKKVNMKKPIKQYPLEKMYDYHEVISYIEKKYNIETRDYANSHSQFDDWCDSKGYGKKDKDGKSRGSSNIWYAEYKEEIEKELIKERPYLDFWHWFLEQDDSISNGTECSLYDIDEYISDEIETPEFVRKILTIIVEEGFTGEENEFVSWVEW